MLTRLTMPRIAAGSRLASVSKRASGSESTRPRPKSGVVKRPAKIVAPGAGIGVGARLAVQARAGVEAAEAEELAQRAAGAGQRHRTRRWSAAVTPLDVLAGAAGRAVGVAGAAAALVEDRAQTVVCVSVGSKFAFAAANVAALVPGSASPSTARRSRPRCRRRSHRRPGNRPRRSPTAAPSDTRLTHRICRVITNLLCGLAPEVWGHEEVERSDRGQAEKHPGERAFRGAPSPKRAHDLTDRGRAGINRRSSTGELRQLG